MYSTKVGLSRNEIPNTPAPTMKMKKFTTLLVAIIGLLTTTISLPTFGQDEDAFKLIIKLNQKVDQIVRIDLVASLFTDKLVNDVIDRAICMVIDSEKDKPLDFNLAHSHAAVETFHSVLDYETPWTSDMHQALGALLISKVKDLLHSEASADNRLLSLYNTYKDTVRAKFDKLSTEQQEKIVKFVLATKSTFEKVRDRKSATAVPDANLNSWQKANTLLMNNTAPEKIAERIKDLSFFQEEEPLTQINAAERFAERRKAEGGIGLVEQYISLLSAMLTDMPMSTPTSTVTFDKK